jgi:hypothetical protein
MVASGRGGGARGRQVMLEQPADARIFEVSGKNLQREASIEKRKCRRKRLPGLRL